MSREVSELMYMADSLVDDLNNDDEAVDERQRRYCTLHEWIEMHYQDLGDAWSDLKEFTEETGDLVFDAADFNDFCEAMYRLYRVPPQK